MLESNTAIVQKDDDGKKSVNDYILEGNLGKGSYGKVKLARYISWWLRAVATRTLISLSCGERHRHNQGQYAIKIMDKARLRKKTLGQKSSMMDDVMREIAIMKVCSAYCLSFAHTLTLTHTHSHSTALANEETGPPQRRQAVGSHRR